MRDPFPYDPRPIRHPLFSMQRMPITVVRVRYVRNEQPVEAEPLHIKDVHHPKIEDIRPLQFTDMSPPPEPYVNVDSVATAERVLIDRIIDALPPPSHHQIYRRDPSYGQKTGPDESPTLFPLINRQANLIATRTRRGKGNFLIASTMAIAELATSMPFAGTSFKRDLLECPILPSGSRLIPRGRISGMFVYEHPDLNKYHPLVVSYHGLDGKVFAGADTGAVLSDNRLIFPSLPEMFGSWIDYYGIVPIDWGNTHA